MPITDCYTLIGSWPHSEVDLSLEALAAGMQTRGVTRSLVTHTTAVFYDPAVGNDQVVQLCSQHAPLIPVAVINPLLYPRCLDEIRGRLEQGVKVFRLCPYEHRYPFSGSVGPLRDVLQELRQARLLLIDLAGLPVPAIASDIEELLTAPVAFSVDGAGLGIVLRAAKDNENVWIETSRLDVAGAIEAALNHMGSARVIFGSGAPLRSIGSAVRTVEYVEMADTDRAAIFEGNVQRVLA